jgi:hypothetical protein
MSNALALAAVAKCIKAQLMAFLANHNASGVIGSLDVSILSPGQINPANITNNQLNIFAYQVTPNPGWCQDDLPLRSAQGDLLKRPLLALDLHFLITAYAKDEAHADALLGYAAQYFHTTPVLTRKDIQQLEVSWLAGSALEKGLAGAGLSAQAELIKISPQPMSSEEISKLWAAFQAQYRPTIAYQASVVLIESDGAARTPLPVLTIGPDDRGVVAQPNLEPPFPMLLDVVFPQNQPTGILDDTVEFRGHHLEGSNVLARFTNLKTKTRLETPSLQSHTATKISLKLSDAQDLDQPLTPPEKVWSVGTYSFVFHVQRPGETYRRMTNTLVFSLAPKVESLSLAITAGELVAEADCKPEVRPDQSISLIVGDFEVLAEPRPTQTGHITFVKEKVKDRLKSGEKCVCRLRVDGVESHFIDRTKTPLVFDPAAAKTIT